MTIDLEFLAKQNERLLTEVASLRDDMGVLTAIAIRLDGTVTALAGEFRATHGQIARMGERLRKLEQAES